MSGDRRWAAVLRPLVRRLWPRRTQLELLLDLGERKAWTSADADVQLSEAARWMTSHMGLGLVAADPQTDLDPARVREPVATARSAETSVGVARWAEGVADAVGAAPKTLANSVGRGLQAHRNDHRWLLAIARCRAEGGAPDAWLYHRRTGAAVGRELSSRAHLERPDAGDALLALSLMALWQRRRPTGEGRANRGRRQPRRTTPKPVAGLTLIEPGQVAPLLGLSEVLNLPDLRLLTLEAALTQAHLAPHPTRRRALTEDGEHLLSLVEGALGDLPEADGAAFRFRVRRMRAWLNREAQPAPEPAALTLPYVRAALALEAVVRRGEPAQGDFAGDEPGLLMLRPQLAATGFRVGRWGGQPGTSSTASTSMPTASAGPTGG